jgi:phospholipid/cholesterol/gamma-HCH transport system substrate-binding protein
MKVVYKKKEKIVGTFFVLIAVLLLSTVVLIGRGKDWFRTYVTYYTIFKEGYNLQENAEVKLTKANIGRVNKISLSEDKVKVELAILQEYASRIKIDSIATVESPTLIGDEYVSIKPGSKDALTISEGGVIPSKEKRSINDFLSEFEVEKTSKMFVKALQNISAITKDLRDPQGPLFGTLDNLNRIVGDIQEGKRVEKILENVKTTTAKTPDTVEMLNENLAQLKQILKDTKESVSLIKVTLKNIEKGSHDIPRVTESTKKGVQEIRDSVENIDKVIQSVQKSFLIKSNIPPETQVENIDAGLR